MSGMFRKSLNIIQEMIVPKVANHVRLRIIYSNMQHQDTSHAYVQILQTRSPGIQLHPVGLVYCDTRLVT